MFQGNEDLDKFVKRREVVFIVLAGLFLGSLAMLNILGISRAIDLSFNLFGWHVPVRLFIGILPYPITFLCTDFISEMYGKRRANIVVWVGLMLNVWVIFILWVGSALPPHPEILSDGLPALDDPNRLFFQLKRLSFGATAASMIAYLSAQFVDVQLFHFLKKLTKGKHLWLRNNGSTLVSQLVDTISVILITHYYAKALPIEEGASVFQTLMVFIISSYVFKFIAALLDTVPFYIGVKFLSKYLNIEPNHHIKKDRE
ncbi:MAG: queuosine precursor transporter [Bacteroidota bacterium]